MPSHASPKAQSGERCYRVVTVSREGTRTILSQHNSSLAAERARMLIFSEDGVEIRIESAVDTSAVKNVG